MFANFSITTYKNYDWSLSKPILRYVLGTCFIISVTTLMDYNLSYLTSVLALSFIAPGAKPLKFKQGLIFIISLTIITGGAYIFSEFFIDYPFVFMPLLGLAILWLYFYDGFPMVIKLFSIVSILIIPLMALEASFVASFVATSLVFNALMAVSLTQIMFWIFPWSSADQPFEKTKKNQNKQTDLQRFKYALNIVIILSPILLLFYIFKLSGGALILIFTAILSMSPALSNPKVGSMMILANVIGGLVAILAYNLLVIVPVFSFMILLTFIVGLIFASNLFSKKKTAPIFGTAFSTFLLILFSVTSSDDDAGSAVWTRVIQISMAVIYVVTAFGILNYIQKTKKEQSL